ncbi:Hypothetical predicted protein [Mytilus galloprovincialis]|uniref:Integrase zinc-binding domain-containing protein n=1 Tax=Mytilus galloprovincialis TaxID=29158 RepID=A0A8B6EQG7_MYTGA|nr:Hypothetical predicted protein [Mytilus galloprovincialis]
MKLAHESLMAGHMATRRTVIGIIRVFTGQELNPMLSGICQSCDIANALYQKDQHYLPTREVPQESVLFSPFELVYGWPVRGPMTILKELWTREITDPEVRSTYEYVINLRERLESTCELVKQNLEKASRKQSRIYNRKSRSRKMKVGQKGIGATTY